MTQNKTNCNCHSPAYLFTYCRQITRETGIPKSSVVRIIHSDLKLKCVEKKRASS